MENEVRYLYLDDIIPNRFQPRENFDEQALKELAVSIKEHGVIQPIVVRQIGEKYEIIAGERRYKASTMAGLTKIPAIIKNLDDKESSKVALIENLQRKDLTPIEEARTYQKILELDALTQEELAKTMGKSQSAVSNKLRLLSLTDEVQDALLHEQISERHARSLLNVEDPQKQVELLRKVISSRMTVRELDEEIKRETVENRKEDNNIKNDNQSIFNPQSFSNIEPLEVEVDKIHSNPENISNNNDSQITDMSQILRPIDNGYGQSLDNAMNSNSNMPKEEIIGGSGLLAGMSLEETVKQPMQETQQSNNIGFENNLYKNFSAMPVETKKNSDDVNNNQFFPNINDIVSSQPSKEKKDVSLTVNKIKDTIENIKKSGSKIEVEEFDFEDFYQIVIRVDKD